MVNLHGHTSMRAFSARLSSRPRTHNIVDDTLASPPPDPSKLLTSTELQDKAAQLLDWWEGKRSVLVITGAGVSTQSGIPDYRGHRGSYHRGHKPMVHDQFMNSHAQRQRYWGRAMVGWREFDASQPNEGHAALTTLERTNRIGVIFDDQPTYHEKDSERWAFGNGQNRVSIITQNVDHLHQQAGTNDVTELHGRGSRLRCMSCGAHRDRNDFHDELEQLNDEWLQSVLSQQEQEQQELDLDPEEERKLLRPDGDAFVARESYTDVVVPPCRVCGTGFLKPDVVFFGDNVPKHRIERCKAAVEAADGLLCIGTSLAVHSAFRFVRRAHNTQTPIAILNVGETRAEAEGIDNLLKVEAPIGPTLQLCAQELLK